MKGFLWSKFAGEIWERPLPGPYMEHIPGEWKGKNGGIAVLPAASAAPPPIIASLAAGLALSTPSKSELALRHAAMVSMWACIALRARAISSTSVVDIAVPA